MPSSSPRRGARFSSDRVARPFFILATSEVYVGLVGDGDIGTIEAGKLADIIAVDGNPLENISELRDMDFVMKGGEVYLNP